MQAPLSLYVRIFINLYYCTHISLCRCKQPRTAAGPVSRINSKPRFCAEQTHMLLVTGTSYACELCLCYVTLPSYEATRTASVCLSVRLFRACS